MPAEKQGKRYAAALRLALRRSSPWSACLGKPRANSISWRCSRNPIPCSQGDARSSQLRYLKIAKHRERRSSRRLRLWGASAMFRPPLANEVVAVHGRCAAILRCYPGRRAATGHHAACLRVGLSASTLRRALSCPDGGGQFVSSTQCSSGGLLEADRTSHQISSVLSRSHCVRCEQYAFHSVFFIFR